LDEFNPGERCEHFPGGVVVAQVHDFVMGPPAVIWPVRQRRTPDSVA
jgi:hypothetical protein